MEVRDTTRTALRRLEDELGRAAGAPVALERPANAEHGDYATNVALRLAGIQKRPPLEIAGRHRGRGDVHLGHRARRDRASRLREPLALAGLVRRGAGRGRRRRARLRARLGRDARARSGRDGEREPDGPDHGRVGPQRRLRRLRGAPARLRGPPGRARVLLQRRRVADGPLPRLGRRRRAAASRLPEDGYSGDYIEELAALDEDPVPQMLRQIEQSLERFRIHFDSWALQSELASHLPELLDRLDTYEHDGAVWIRSTALRRREGQGPDPLGRARRPADLRGRGHRLPARQARARLRPCDLRPRRRPPRRPRLVPASSRRCSATTPSASR